MNNINIPATIALMWLIIGVVDVVAMNIGEALTSDYDDVENILGGSFLVFIGGPIAVPFLLGILIKTIRATKADHTKYTNAANAKIVREIYKKYSDDANAQKIPLMAQDEEWLDHWSLVKEVADLRSRNG